MTGSFNGKSYDLRQKIARRLYLDPQLLEPERDLIQVGFDSLAFLDFIQQVGRELRITVNVQETFTQRTLRALAKRIAGVVAAGALVDGPSDEDALAALGREATVDKAHRHEPFPLTDTQQAYWVGRDSGYLMGNVACHIYREIEGQGIDLHRLTAAWRCLVERHDMLRAVFEDDGRQRILTEVPPYDIVTQDLRGLDKKAVEERLLALRDRMSHRIYPLDRWPLFEICASQLDGGRTRLGVSLDALVADLYSVQLLTRELVALYREPKSVLPPLTFSFRDYILAAEALHETDLYRRAREYWMNRLDTLPPGPELPLARDPATVTRPRFVPRLHRIEADAWRRLKAQAARAGLTPSGVLLATYADILANWSTTPRFTLSLTLFNRLPLHPEIKNLVGDFTSVILLEVDLSRKDSFAARARRVQEQLWKDLPHRTFSGVQVARELARRRPGSNAVTPVVFTSGLGLGDWGDEDMLPGLGEIVYTSSQTPQVWIDQQAVEQGGGLLMTWDTVDEIFPEGMIDEMFRSYCEALRKLGSG